MDAPTGVDWSGAVAVLAVALVLGGALLWRLRSATALSVPAPVAPLEVRDLEGRRDALIQQLRELEDTASRRTPEQLARERAELERAAALVLRDIDRHARVRAAAPVARAEAAAAPPAAAPFGEPAGSPALRGFLWTTSAMAACGLLLFLLTQNTRGREQGAPLTGDVGPPSREATTPDADEARLRQAVLANPEDVEARLDLARLHLQRQDMMAVWNETRAVLDRKPGHPRALSYQALVRLAMGQAEVALTMARQAVGADPSLLEGYLHLALVQTRLGRGAEADATIAEATRRFPAQAAALQRVLGEMRSSAAAETPAGAGEAEAHAAIAPPPDAQAGTRAGGARMVGGTVALDPSARVAPGALLFVTVRDEGVEGGAPIAAKRMPAGPFPATFRITSADSMMGGELPDRMRVEARVDSDGDPSTRSPTDPVARVDGVSIGSTSVKLVLKTP